MEILPIYGGHHISFSFSVKLISYKYIGYIQCENYLWVFFAKSCIKDVPEIIVSIHSFNSQLELQKWLDATHHTLLSLAKVVLKIIVIFSILQL